MVKKRLSVLLLTLLMTVLLSGCGVLLAVGIAGDAVYDAMVSDEQQYARALKTNWEITLPDGYEIMFYDSERHPRGEGPRYCALYYADSAVLESFRPWTAEEKATTCCGSYSELAEETLTALSVPEEYQPNGADGFWWYTHSAGKDVRDEILMLWSGNMLYIVEGLY